MYQRTIKDLGQPLIESKLNEKDKRREKQQVQQGLKMREERTVYLIPELCSLTGLYTFFVVAIKIFTTLNNDNTIMNWLFEYARLGLL
jgi:hypothetical protein